jgi:hypothetical protein
MTKLLEHTEDFLDSTIYKFALHYISGCPVGKGPTGFLDQVEAIIRVARQVWELATEVGKAASDLTALELFESVCGTGTDPKPLEKAARTVQVVTCGLGASLHGIQNFFACQNWRPLHTTVMYHDECAL